MTLLIVVAFDYGFLDEPNTVNNQQDQCVPFLSMMDTSTGMVGATMVRAKGNDDYSVKACVAPQRWHAP